MDYLAVSDNKTFRSRLPVVNLAKMYRLGGETDSAIRRRKRTGVT